jgi:hypothetical protein
MNIKVDNLDNQINLTKTSMVHGVYLSEYELNLLFEKIAQRALLNHELIQVREGESLMIHALLII